MYCLYFIANHDYSGGGHHNSLEKESILKNLHISGYGNPFKEKKLDTGLIVSLLGFNTLL